MHKHFFRPSRNSGIYYDKMFLNTCPVFLSSFIYVGLTLGQMLSVSTESYKPFNSSLDEVQIITKACFKTYAFPGFSSMWLGSYAGCFNL